MPCRQTRELHLIHRVDGLANFVRSLSGAVRYTAAENAEAVVKGVEYKAEALAYGFGAAGKIDNEGSFSDHRDTAAEHSTIRDLRGAHTDVFRNAGRISIREYTKE